MQQQSAATVLQASTVFDLLKPLSCNNDLH
jgi:hypothetical protein